MQRFWLVGIAAVLATILLFPATALAQTAPAASPASAIDAALLFEQSCAACHVGGGNIVRRGKNLKTKALKRYGMDSQEAIANIITNGKGIMSAYGEDAKNGAPIRLTAPEIEALADYVLVQAAADWQ